MSLKLVVNNDEPRILDIDRAERLGMKNQRAIRLLIKDNTTELALHGELSAALTVSKKRGPKPKVYYLNEEQALLVCMFSRTSTAAAVRKEVIDTYMAYRRGQLELSAKGTVELPDFGNPAAAARAWAELWERRRSLTTSSPTT